MPNCTLTIRLEGTPPSTVDLKLSQGRIVSAYTWTFHSQVLGPPLGALGRGSGGSYDDRLPTILAAQALHTGLASPRWSIYIEPRSSYLATVVQGLIFIIAGLPTKPVAHQSGTGLYFPYSNSDEEGIPVKWMVRAT